LCVMQALLSFTSEARLLRYAHTHPRCPFPYLPQQPGYDKRLRKLAGTVNWLIRQLATGTSLCPTTCVCVVDPSATRRRGFERGRGLVAGSRSGSIVAGQPEPGDAGEGGKQP
jgi:hypothetical protein